MSREFIIYCDESVSKGAYFANFYGGVLVRSEHIDRVRETLLSRKSELNLFGEVKWQKITEQYEQKYIDLVDTIFDLVQNDQMKIRVMFTQNIHIPTGLSNNHHENAYFILYYLFLKMAFGLEHSNPDGEVVNLRIYPDNIPNTAEKTEQFRDYIAALDKYAPFRKAGIQVRKENVAEIDSKEHVIAQAIDIILGSMQFRLNDHHKVIPAGATRRGKRTRAKERVYRHINARIRGMYPNFNIGITTGTRGDLANRWNDNYRHWRFVPSEKDIDLTRGKKKRAERE